MLDILIDNVEKLHFAGYFGHSMTAFLGRIHRSSWTQSKINFLGANVVL